MTHVLNPKTNRMIKIGGKPWRKLVREGMLPNTPTDFSGQKRSIDTTGEIKQSLISNNILYEAETPQQADQAKEEILTEQAKQTLKLQAQELGQNQHPRRKGKKIVKVVTAPKHEDLAKYTAQCASRTLHKHINDLSDQLEYAYANSNELDASQLSEFENSLKELILQEMISGEANKAPDIKTMKKKVNSKFDQNYAETDYELDSQFGDTEEYSDDEKSD